MPRSAPPRPIRRRRDPLVALAAAAGLLVPGFASAQEPDASGSVLESVFGRAMTPRLSFSAFGTLGYAALDEPDAEYRSGVAVDGADEAGSIELDTRLGVQLDARLTGKLSATVQVIGREGSEGEAEAGLEWGLIRYLVTDSIAVRVGRMSLPVFALSDFREVGYANVLLRLPEDVYSQIPLRRFDGLDVTYETAIARTLLSAQVYAGASSEALYDGLEPDAEDSVGVALVAERGPFRARLGHVSTSFRIRSEDGSIARVRAGLLQTIAQQPALAGLADVAEDFDPGRVPLRFDSLGLGYDPGRWFVDAEYARRRVDNWVADVDSWSLAGGVRLGELTPYAFASVFDDIDDDRRLDLPEEASALEAGVNTFYEPRDQRTGGLGLRWDVRPGIALKGQLEYVTRDVVGQSLRRAADGMRDSGDDVTLFSAALDFVF